MQKISKTFFPILGKIRKSHFFMNLLRDFWVQSYSGAEYSGFPIEENILKGNEIWRQLEHPSLNLEEINELSVSSIRYITWTSAELKKKEEDCPTPPLPLYLSLTYEISSQDYIAAAALMWHCGNKIIGSPSFSSYSWFLKIVGIKVQKVSWCNFPYPNYCYTAAATV